MDEQTLRMEETGGAEESKTPLESGVTQDAGSMAAEAAAGPEAALDDDSRAAKVAVKPGAALDGGSMAAEAASGSEAALDDDSRAATATVKPGVTQDGGSRAAEAVAEPGAALDDDLVVVAANVESEAVEDAANHGEDSADNGTADGVLPEGGSTAEESEAAWRRRAEACAARAVLSEARAAAAMMGVPENRLDHAARLSDLSGIDPEDEGARERIARAVRVALAELPELIGGVGTGRATSPRRARHDAFERGFLGEQGR